MPTRSINQSISQSAQANLRLRVRQAKPAKPLNSKARLIAACQAGSYSSTALFACGELHVENSDSISSHDHMSNILIDSGASAPQPCFEAAGLAYSYPDVNLLGGLSLSIKPGLTLVRGGEGRGKRVLLRLIAGELQPQAGVVLQRAGTLCFESPADPASDNLLARDWLAARQSRFSNWQAAQAAELIQGFGLTEHMAKPLYMLSTGSRRKVGLVAAAASAAQLTLIDRPFAALDATSCRLLAQLLVEASASQNRAWVIADYELPTWLTGVSLSGVIDLGD
jgi:ABC-type transport system involved in cytochrome c biogenesis ATPase subunit